MPNLSPALLCFAVRDEARFCNPALGRILVTGMGSQTALREASRALAELRPAVVFTCGFAGGLNPAFGVGSVLFATDNPELAARIHKAGATRAQFCTSETILVTQAEKRRWRVRTRADAVEMESAAIQQLCRQHRIPCATLRAISDAAHQDLPLDFNALVSPEGRLQPGALVRAILLHPMRIPGLIRLGTHSRLAARNLATVLETTLAPS